jgi:hypothetical protein
MFSNERIVKVGNGLLFFVDVNHVEGQVNQAGRVKVRLLKTNGEVFWAIMPTEDVAVVQVPKDQMEPVSA